MMALLIPSSTKKLAKKTVKVGLPLIKLSGSTHDSSRKHVFSIRVENIVDKTIFKPLIMLGKISFKNIT